MCVPSLTVVQIIQMLGGPCMWGLKSFLVIVSRLAYAHCSTVLSFQSNSTSGSHIPSMPPGMGSWHVTGRIIPITWESLSLLSIVALWVSISVWATPRDPSTMEGFTSVMHGETAPMCSTEVGVCQTSSSPSAHCLAFV